MLLIIIFCIPSKQPSRGSIDWNYGSRSPEFTPQSLNQLDTLNPNYGDLPLVVIARNRPSSEIQNKNTKHYIWVSLQENLSSRSTDSTLIFTGERQHSINKVQPKVVIEAIQTLVNGL